MSARGSRPKMSRPKIDRTGFAAVQFDHVKFHYASPPSAGASSAGASVARQLRQRRISEQPATERILGQWLFHGVLDRHPTTFGARNSTFDHDQATIGVGAHNLQVLSGHAHRPIWPAIFLPLNTLARVLTLTSRTVRTVADRNTVRGTQTAEVMALHRTGKTFTDRGARHVNELTFEIMVCGDLFANGDQILRAIRGIPQACA
jgi:hypothetical protein